MRLLLFFALLIPSASFSVPGPLCMLRLETPTVHSSRHGLLDWCAQYVDGHDDTDGSVDGTCVPRVSEERMLLAKIVRGIGGGDFSRPGSATYPPTLDRDCWYHTADGARSLFTKVRELATSRGVDAPKFVLDERFDLIQWDELQEALERQDLDYSCLLQAEDDFDEVVSELGLMTNPWTFNLCKDGASCTPAVDNHFGLAVDALPNAGTDAYKDVVFYIGRSAPNRELFATGVVADLRQPSCRFWQNERTFRVLQHSGHDFVQINEKIYQYRPTDLNGTPKPPTISLSSYKSESAIANGGTADPDWFAVLQGNEACISDPLNCRIENTPWSSVPLGAPRHFGNLTSPWSWVDEGGDGDSYYRYVDYVDGLSNLAAELSSDVLGPQGIPALSLSFYTGARTLTDPLVIDDPNTTVDELALIQGIGLVSTVVGVDVGSGATSQQVADALAMFSGSYVAESSCGKRPRPEPDCLLPGFSNNASPVPTPQIDTLDPGGSPEIEVSVRGDAVGTADFDVWCDCPSVDKDTRPGDVCGPADGSTTGVADDTPWDAGAVCSASYATTGTYRFAVEVVQASENRWTWQDVTVAQSSDNPEFTIDFNTTSSPDCDSGNENSTQAVGDYTCNHAIVGECSSGECLRIGSASAGSSDTVQFVVGSGTNFFPVSFGRDGYFRFKLRLLTPATVSSSYSNIVRIEVDGEETVSIQWDPDSSPAELRLCVQPSGVCDVFSQGLLIGTEYDVICQIDTGEVPDHVQCWVDDVEVAHIDSDLTAGSDLDEVRFMGAFGWDSTFTVDDWRPYTLANPPISGGDPGDPTPTLAVSDVANVACTTTQGGGGCLDSTALISNTGEAGSLLSFDVTLGTIDDCGGSAGTSWYVAASSGGPLAPGDSPELITASYTNEENCDPGTYTAVFEIDAPGANGSPVQQIVSLTVNPTGTTPLYACGSGNFSDPDQWDTAPGCPDVGDGPPGVSQQAIVDTVDDVLNVDVSGSAAQFDCVAGSLDASGSVEIAAGGFNFNGCADFPASHPNYFIGLRCIAPSQCFADHPQASGINQAPMLTEYLDADSRRFTLRPGNELSGYDWNTNQVRLGVGGVVDVDCGNVSGGTCPDDTAIEAINHLDTGCLDVTGSGTIDIGWFEHEGSCPRNLLAGGYTLTGNYDTTGSIASRKRYTHQGDLTIGGDYAVDKCVETELGGNTITVNGGVVFSDANNCNVGSEMEADNGTFVASFLEQVNDAGIELKWTGPDGDDNKGAFVFSGAVVSTGVERFVAESGGSDAGDCTSGSECATVARAINVANGAGGGTILIERDFSGVEVLPEVTTAIRFGAYGAGEPPDVQVAEGAVWSLSAEDIRLYEGTWRSIGFGIPSSNVVADLAVSRTVCEAPCSINANLFDSTVVGDFTDCEYETDYGDPGKGNHLYGANSWDKNYEVGPNGAHVYEDPGFYTLTGRVWCGAELDVDTELIEVRDPDVVYSGDKTICISNDTAHVGCDWVGAQTIDNVTTWQQVLDECDLENPSNTSGTRCALRRGDEFTPAAATNLRASNWQIMRYGAGANPLINAHVGGGHNTMRFNDPLENATVWGLDIEGDVVTKGNYCVSAFDGSGFSNLLFYQGGVRYCDSLVFFHHSNSSGAIPPYIGVPRYITFAEMDLRYSSGNGGQDFYVTMLDWALIGSRLGDQLLTLDTDTDQETGEHLIRVKYARNGLLAHNQLGWIDRSGVLQPAFLPVQERKEVVGCCFNNAAGPGHCNSNLGGTLATLRSSWGIIYGPTGISTRNSFMNNDMRFCRDISWAFNWDTTGASNFYRGEYHRHDWIENNRMTTEGVTGGSPIAYQFRSTEHAVIRNNVADLTGFTGGGATGIRLNTVCAHIGGPDGTVNDDIKIVGNTIYANGSVDIIGVSGGTKTHSEDAPFCLNDFTNVVLDDSLAWSPGTTTLYSSGTIEDVECCGGSCPGVCNVVPGGDPFVSYAPPLDSADYTPNATAVPSPLNANTCRDDNPFDALGFCREDSPALCDAGAIDTGASVGSCAP